MREEHRISGQGSNARQADDAGARNEASATIINRRRVAIVTVLWLTGVLSGAVYHLAVGIERLRIGDEPGEGPPLDRFYAPMMRR